METEKKYPIKVVVRKTGLTPHVLRAWEKRYKVVSPSRTPTNRRLYSDADIERLRLLRGATLAGHSIGQIAQLPNERLLELVAADDTAMSYTPHRRDAGWRESSPASYLDVCIDAVKHLDVEALETALADATITLSQPVLIEGLVVPLMHQIGELWRDGVLRVAHEHLASAIVRNLLGNMNGRPEIPASAPNLIATTPAGQLHEVGALIAAVTAVSEGWRVAYLGPNLPAEEIAGAAQQCQAKAVALSIVYPADDPYLGNELKKLRRGLSEEVAVLVGGRAVDAYAEVLDAIGAVRPKDMPSFRQTLERLRSGSCR